MHMMLAHLCEEPFQLMRKSVILVLPIYLLAAFDIDPLGITDRHLLFLGDVLSLISYGHMVYFTTMELSTALNIRVFHVKKVDKKQ